MCMLLFGMLYAGLGGVTYTGPLPHVLLDMRLRRCVRRERRSALLDHTYVLFMSPVVVISQVCRFVVLAKCPKLLWDGSTPNVL